MCTARKDGLNLTRTGCGEGGAEPDILQAVPAIPISDAVITARDEDASSTHQALRTGDTNSPYIQQGHSAR
jgi:hypothetical protein